MRSKLTLSSRFYTLHLLLPIVVLVIVPARSQTGAAQEVRERQEVREPQSPIFSRDGRQIVYVAGVKKNGELLPSSREIWLVNTDGTNPRRLSVGPQDEQPRFSPDGRQVVFIRGHDVWVINTDGSGLRNLTNTPDAREGGAEFMNDGASLVFLRLSKDTLDPKLKAEIARETPLAALGFDSVQSVVLRNLQSGAERVLLGDGYNVVQVTPVYFDNNVVFILCGLIDNDGKPVAKLSFDREVAVLKLDGSLPRSVARLKPGTKMTLKALRVRPDNNIAEVSLSDKIGSYVGVLQAGEVTLLPDAPVFGDVSHDGTTLVGTGLLDANLNSRIVLYDIATAKTRLLGEPLTAAPSAPVIPPQAPAVATTSPVPSIRAVAREHFEHGKEFFDEDRYTEAISAFTKATAAYPQYADAYYYRGWSHDLNDDKKSALRDLAEAIRIDPKHANAYITRAQIYERDNDFDAAIKDFTAAMAADTTNYLGAQYRGELYAQRGDWKKAIADFTEALKIYPKNLTVLLERGEAQFKLRDYAAALADYSEAVKHYPTFAGAYKSRAQVHRAMGKPDLAAADERKAKELTAKS